MIASTARVPASKTEEQLTEEELVRDEGLRFKVYRCTAGKRSIGAGRNLDDVGISTAETQKLGITVKSCIDRGITYDQAMVLLRNDIARAKADLDRSLPWWRSLSPVRQRVLINMCFNMGIGNKAKGLLSFVNTLEHIRSGRYAQASLGMLASKWHADVGARAVRLAAMMKTGAA